MMHCQRCLFTTDHPFGLKLDTNGICQGCRVFESRDQINWEEQFSKLKKITDEYRDTNNYDCIVPVSGAGDSYFMVHLVKERLGLNPLLVTYNKYYNTPIGMKNLENLRVRFNCDIIYQNVNPISVKNITRTTLNQYGSIDWALTAGENLFPIQTALRYKVPLVIFGEHLGVEEVGMFSYDEEVELTQEYLENVLLKNKRADDLVTVFNTLKEEHIWQYRYPDIQKLNNIGFRGIYLSNYIPWDKKRQHEEMIKLYGFQSAKQFRTFDTYDNVDCYNQTNLQDLLNLYQYGYSKVTEHVTREIRHGRLSRDEAIQLVQHYETIPPQFTDYFCKWLDIPQRSLQFLMDLHRNKKYWSQTESLEWNFKGWSTHLDSKDYDDVSNIMKNYTVNNTLEPEGKSGYITVGAL